MIRQTLLLCALGLGCSSEPLALLSIDLRSDYAPGSEIAQVVTRLELGDGFERHTNTDLSELVELSEGTRIATFDSLDVGSYRLHVDAFDGDGEVVASRLGVVEVRGDIALTIVFSRACLGRSCPEAGDDPNATECVGGVCVSPECFPETPSLCLMPCTTTDECPDQGCGTGICRDSICQFVQDPSRCASGMCGADFRCVAVMDAGTDAGNDAGPPPPDPDAGPPPPSCPANALSCPSALRDWEATSEWFCREDEKIARARYSAVCRVCNEGGCNDCRYGNIDVDCRCTEPSTCDDGRCTSGIELDASRCDEGSMNNNFSCPEITDVVCR